jgi:thiol-disulfide isomerase/thioredoxin
MTMRTAVAAAAAGLLLSAAAAQAQDQQLKVGDAAPGLDIEKWVKGPETAIEKGKVFVVEFWATWCLPCKKSIPHLNDLYQEFEEDGLVVIGISDENAEVVGKFVKAQGEKMSYRVAVDRRAQTSRSWKEAAKLSGIPAVFIVDRSSRIQYIGNPLETSFESTLRRVMAGRFDATMDAEVEPIISAARSARKVRNWRSCMKYLDMVVEFNPQVYAPYNLEKFEIMLIDQDDPKKAYEFATTLIGKYASDAPFLASLAEKIATDPIIPNEKRDMAVAMSAAAASKSAGKPDSPEGYAIVALVHFYSGNVKEAVNLQKNAYFKATPKKKAEYKRVLDSYQAAAERSASKAQRAP